MRPKKVEKTVSAQPQIDKYELLIKKYDDVSNKIKLLEIYRDKIRKTIEKCLESDGIDKVTRLIDGYQWVITYIVRKNRKVDFNMLINEGLYDKVVKENEVKYLSVNCSRKPVLDVPEGEIL